MYKSEHSVAHASLFLCWQARGQSIHVVVLRYVITLISMSAGKKHANNYLTLVDIGLFASRDCQAPGVPLRRVMFLRGPIMSDCYAHKDLTHT